jgi:molybdopterin converting factor small subunit
LDPGLNSRKRRLLKVKVVLHSYLREKLPPEAKGRAELDFPPGALISDLFTRLDLPIHVAWSLNNHLEHDLSTPLSDGDEVRVFRQGAGG